MNTILGVLLIYWIRITNEFSDALRLPIQLGNYPSATKDSFTWRMENGAYKFGMQGQDQWRVEKRLPGGKVYVRYAYRAPNGQVIENTFSRGAPVEEFFNDEGIISPEMFVRNSFSNSEERLNVDNTFVPDYQTGLFGESDSDVITSEDKLFSSDSKFSVSPQDREAMPYGAISDAFQKNDFVDTNAIIDDETKSVVRDFS